MARAKKADSARTCFVIGPIGATGTTTRRVADQVFKYVVKPVVEPLGYDPTRADMLGEPGLVTRQVMRRVMEDELVVADLTGKNPNVFYELAIRHAIRKPLVQIISGDDTLPFDVLDTRTIFFDISDLDSVEEAKQELDRQIQSLIADPKPLDNPISETLDLEKYRDSGDSTEAAFGQVLEALADVRGEMHSLRRRVEANPVVPSSYLPTGAKFTGPTGPGLVLAPDQVELYKPVQATDPDLAALRRKLKAKMPDPPKGSSNDKSSGDS